MLSALLEADDPDVNDYFVADKNAPIHYDPADDPEQLDLEATEDDEDVLETAPEDQKRIAALLKVIATLEREKLESGTAELTVMSPVKKVCINYGLFRVALRKLSFVQFVRRLSHHRNAVASSSAIFGTTTPTTSFCRR